MATQTLRQRPAASEHDPWRRFGEAARYAHRVHSRQRRPGTDEPYAEHLFRLAIRVIEDGGSEAEAIAALLHDAPEDRGGQARLADIRCRFGPAVATIVDSLTDTYEDPGPPWRVRKERYVAHLEDSPPGRPGPLADEFLHAVREFEEVIGGDAGVVGSAN